MNGLHAATHNTQEAHTPARTRMRAHTHTRTHTHTHKYLDYILMAVLYDSNCREGSNEKLRNARDGTFLVRPTKNAKVPHHVYTVDIK